MFCCSEFCRSDKDLHQIEFSLHKEREYHNRSKFYSKDCPTLPKDKDSIKVKETGDELSFFEVKNTKSKFDNKNDVKNGNFSNSCLNIIDNNDNLIQSNSKKEYFSHWSSFHTDNLCKEYKYAIVGKKIVKLCLNQSIENTLNIIKTSREFCINTYTSPCKNKQNKCYKTNISHSKYNCSDEFHISRASWREKTPNIDISSIKLTDSQINNVKEKNIPSQNAKSNKQPEKNPKNSKILSIPSKDLSSIKVKIEYNKYKKTKSCVTKK